MLVPEPGLSLSFTDWWRQFDGLDMCPIPLVREYAKAGTVVFDGPSDGFDVLAGTGVVGSSQQRFEDVLAWVLL